MATTPLATTRPPKQEIRIVSHSPLFYWWPVWAVGFLFGILSWFSGSNLAVVPNGSARVKVSEGNATVEMPSKDAHGTKPQGIAGEYVVVAPPKRGEELDVTGLHIANSKRPGVIFCTVLLLVIAISNISMRGLWSVIIIILIVFLSIIFAITRLWDTIADTLSLLDIRITQGGYFFISGILFAIWFVVFMFFDQQIYMVFTPGQFRVRLEIGEGETSYDTTGMTVQKQRSDLFRHWILGLGSGDLIVRTAGVQAHHFDLPNVLFLGRKVREIEDLLRSRQVVAGQP